MKIHVLKAMLLFSLAALAGCPPCQPFYSCNQRNTAVYSPNGSVEYGIPAYAANGAYYALADEYRDGKLVVFNEGDDSIYWMPDLQNDIKGYSWSSGTLNLLAVMYHVGGPLIDPNLGEIAFYDPARILVIDVDSMSSVADFWVEGYHHLMIFEEDSDCVLIFAASCGSRRVRVDFSDMLIEE